MLFVHPVPEATIEIYGDDYFQGGVAGHGYVDYDADKLPMVFTFNKYLDLIENFRVTKGRSVFDVGAATGFFLNIARERGWDCAGVEPSNFASAQGRKKGLDVRTGVFDDSLGIADASLDLITMWDVIEHLPDPRTVVALAHRCLKPGGLLALNTPDAGSFLARLLGMRWHLVVPPEHLMLFAEPSLRYLLETEGFEILLATRIGKKFTTQYVFQTLARQGGMQWLRPFGGWLENNSLGKIQLPINLFDNIMLIARRKP